MWPQHDGFVLQVSDDDEYPKTICSNCKCQLDMLVKFIDDLLNAQLFFKNVHTMYKSKQFSSVEYIPPTDERITLKSSVKKHSMKCVTETRGLTLTDENDIVLETHLENHHGNEFQFNINPSVGTYIFITWLCAYECSVQSYNFYY